MTLVPAVPNLFAYKILSCVFDYVVAIAAALLVYRISEGDKKWHSVLVYSIILLCPTVFIDSSAWAQCDAIYTAFAFLGFCCLEKEKPNWALVLLGISFSFKMHAVFALPFFLFYYFAKRRFSILRFAIVPALPAMHGRYSYLYEICAIALAVIIPKTIPLAAGQIVLSCCTYCSYLFYTPTNHKSLAWINIAIYLAYVLIFSKELRDGFSQSTKTEELLLEDSQSSDNE